MQILSCEFLNVSKIVLIKNVSAYGARTQSAYEVNAELTRSNRTYHVMLAIVLLLLKCLNKV